MTKNEYMLILQQVEQAKEEAKAEICDNYCRFPFNTEDQEELNAICADCPLSNL